MTPDFDFPQFRPLYAEIIKMPIVMRNPIDLSMVDYWLDEWRAWMSSRDSVRGFGGRTPGMQGARGLASEDWQSITYDQQDRAAAVAIGAKIESLPLHQQQAIYRAYGQASAFRWPRLDYQTVLAAAKKQLGEWMRRDGWPC